MTEPEALANCLAEAFRRLARGVADRRSPFHTPALATVAPDGSPEVRTLVLRGFDPQQRAIRLHSDARSRKVASLRHEPRCALHFYDAGAALQLRVAGVARIHDADAVAEAAWRASREASRKCYAVEPGPGVPVPAPPPAPADSAAGWPHFRVILIRFDRLDFLELAASGHRRAGFSWPADGAPDAAWLVP
ncbi:pyridoxamine 5'-phosphate oxidase [Falsiroseomonas bella]|uniref:Pyridoxamine 5'-phosphate oxidase n=1 Tax=Falsiroseomonas bella TaxID=2184016 RepID=A0A317F883_9PROT|nr:pyridoxamine 5'-phosphate oxidase family protein [Falsiroseomonas bella]PWS34633.1 pyridoxamine 5'-phosphate oxidase [Falsiroseomonas bella]